MTEQVYRIRIAADGSAEPAGGWWGSVDPVSADEPLLAARDLGASRGDGIFETFGTSEGRAQAVGAHLTRFAASAEALDLPAPHIGQLTAVVERAASQLAAGQGSIKLVMTRGIEGTGHPTGWMVASTIAPSTFARQRRDGIDVVLLERGYPSDIAERAPWVLAGAKTLSYATNMAALREAQKRGADDAVFLSTDGYLLEAPTSSLVVRLGGVFVTTPPASGILAGTTQADLFAALHGWGERCEYRLMTPAELRDADGAWLLSSVRLAAPVRSVDGAAMTVDVALTGRMNEALLGR